MTHEPMTVYLPRPLDCCTRYGDTIAPGTYRATWKVLCAEDRNGRAVDGWIMVPVDNRRGGGTVDEYVFARALRRGEIQQHEPLTEADAEGEILLSIGRERRRA